MSARSARAEELHVLQSDIKYVESVPKVYGKASALRLIARAEELQLPSAEQYWGKGTIAG